MLLCGHIGKHAFMQCDTIVYFTCYTLQLCCTVTHTAWVVDSVDLFVCFSTLYKEYGMSYRVV